MNESINVTSYLQQHAAVCIHIGPGVLGFTLLQEHIGYNLVKLGDQLEHGVIRQMLQSKLPLAGITWVSLSKDGMAVAWNHLRHHEPRVECKKTKKLSLL